MVGKVMLNFGQVSFRLGYFYVGRESGIES